METRGQTAGELSIMYRDSQEHWTPGRGGQGNLNSLPTPLILITSIQYLFRSIFLQLLLACELVSLLHGLGLIEGGT